MATKHKWTFKSRFRRETYSWNATALASKRMREAVSEIKKVAKKDSAQAGEGVIELFSRIYPAVMHIDGSSGALGTAVNKTIETLIPIIIKADWDMNTRGKWLEKLYQAVCDDGWDLLSVATEEWGKICVYPGLAHLWADRFYPEIKTAWTNKTHDYGTGTADICMSCLLETERYDELHKLISARHHSFWPYDKFWAEALVRRGKIDEAIEYAESISPHDIHISETYEIASFCEQVLIDHDRSDEAYEKYGLTVPFYGVYNNIFRGICKKYPKKDKRDILLDLIEKTVNKSKWFAAAKTIGELDLALECTQSGDCDPGTLLRATRDFSEKNPGFALKVGIEAMMVYLTANFHDPIQPEDIKGVYVILMTEAVKSDGEQWVQTELSKRVLKNSNRVKKNLNETIMELLKQKV